MPMPWEDFSDTASDAPAAAPQKQPWDELQSQMDAIANDGTKPAPEAPQIPLRFQEGDKSPEGFLSNIKKSGQQYTGDVMSTLLHPGDTMSNLRSLFTGDGLTALKDYYVKSYGSVPNALKTAYNDPVGFLSDVSILGKPTSLAGSLAELPNIERAGVAIQNLDPATAAGTLAKYGPSAYAVANRDSALNPQRAYENKLKMPLSPTSRYSNQRVRDSVTSTLLDNEIPLTPRGVETLRGRIDARTAQLDQLVEQADQAGTRIPIGDVLTNLRELRQELGNPLTNPEHAADIATMNNFVRDWLQGIGPVRSLTPSQVRTLRQTLDNKINWNKIDTTTPPTVQRVRESVAHGARQSLGEAVDPGGSTARDISTMLTALQPLNKAAAQQRNNNIFSLPALGVGGMTGAAAHLTGNKAADTLAGLAAAVAAAKVMSTDTKLALARKIWANSDLGEAARRNLIRQLAVQTGRGSSIASGKYDYMEPPQ